MIKILHIISRIIVGTVFLFSGFVKGIDPLGSNYKFIDYFTAFGMDFLNPLALPLGIILSTFEFVLGAMLIFHVKPKISAWLLLGFMTFFTLLTFFLALENPVHDCGCFGDAIVMTNWQTFWKNMILMVFVVIIFAYRNRIKPSFTNNWQWGIASMATMVMLSFTYYCYNHLPIFDFRPYKVGTNIPEKMIIPEEAPQPEYKTILRYKKNGKIKEFTMDSLPDSTWQWVETKNIKVKEGYKPPIDDLTISTLEGEDITDLVLREKGFTFWLIAHGLEKADTSHMEAINRMASFCSQSNHCSFIGLTASLENQINKFKARTGVSFPFYHSDEIELKTIIRANPGLMLVKNGMILGKWHNNDIPVPETFREEFISNPEYKDSGHEIPEKQNEQKVSIFLRSTNSMPGGTILY
jgi:uncharacterized membrane protein YphA (DoxX/SURF4 family)